MPEPFHLGLSTLTDHLPRISLAIQAFDLGLGGFCTLPQLVP